MFKIIVGIFFVLFGLSILLNFSLFKFFFSFLIIYIGIRMIMGASCCTKKKELNEEKDIKDVNEVMIFSPVEMVLKLNNFTGGKIVMIFSGGKIDLRGCILEKDGAELEIVSIFGGAKVIVPKSWKVTVDGASVIGGYDNLTSASKGPELRIKGVSIFGGLTIHNQ